MKLQESLDKVEDHLSKLDEQKFDKIAFEWEGISFKAVTEKIADDLNQIKLDARLGRLFYTIEDAAQRAMAIERLSSNNRSTDGAYSISKQGEVFFKSLTTSKEALLGTDLLNAVTVILLQSGSHLRSLKSHLKN